MRGSFPHVISTCESDPKEKKKEKEERKEKLEQTREQIREERGEKLAIRACKKKKEESVEREREILSSL